MDKGSGGSEGLNGLEGRTPPGQAPKGVFRPLLTKGKLIQRPYLSEP